MPNTVLKCGKAIRFNAHSLSQIPVSFNADKIEILICLFDEQLARHFEIHWRETWRHTCMILMFSKSPCQYFYHTGVRKTDQPDYAAFQFLYNLTNNFENRKNQGVAHA